MREEEEEGEEEEYSVSCNAPLFGVQRGNVLTVLAKYGVIHRVVNPTQEANLFSFTICPYLKGFGPPEGSSQTKHSGFF